MSSYDEIPSATGGVNINGYEHLRQWGNVYNTLNEVPVPPATGKPEAPASKPPVKPKPEKKKKPRSSLDSEGYLKF